MWYFTHAMTHTCTHTHTQKLQWYSQIRPNVCSHISVLPLQKLAARESQDYKVTRWAMKWINHRMKSWWMFFNFFFYWSNSRVCAKVLSNQLQEIFLNSFLYLPWKAPITGLYGILSQKHLLIQHTRQCKSLLEAAVIMTARYVSVFCIVKQQL